MGIGVSRQGRTPWWPEGAAWAIETVPNGRSWNATLSCTRAGTKFAQTLAGGWQNFGPHIPAMTDRGLLVEPAATNLCATHNATPSLTGWTKTGDPAATFSIVDDTAALAAAGLLDLCPSGQVYRLDNGAGVATANVASSGGTLTTSVHGVSAFARGNGTYRLGVQNNSPNFSASAGYGRRTYQGNPSFGGAQFFLLAQPGTVVHFIMNQLEAAVISSPIVTSGAASTRPADIASLSLPSGNWRVVTTSEAGTSEFWVSGESFQIPTSASYVTGITGYVA